MPAHTTSSTMLLFQLPPTTRCPFSSTRLFPCSTLARVFLLFSLLLVCRVDGMRKLHVENESKKGNGKCCKNITISTFIFHPNYRRCLSLCYYPFQKKHYLHSTNRKSFPNKKENKAYIAAAAVAETTLLIISNFLSFWVCFLVLCNFILLCCYTFIIFLKKKRRQLD